MKLRQVIIHLVSRVTGRKTAFSGFAVRNEMIAKCGPMTGFKNGVVVNSSVNGKVDAIPPVGDYVGVEYPAWGNNSPSRKNNFFHAGIISVYGWFSNASNNEVLGRRSPSVFENYANAPMLADLGLCIDIAYGYPRPLVQKSVISRLIHGLSRSLGGFPHFVKLAVVNTSNDDGGYQEKPVYDNKSQFSLLYKIIGLLLFVAGTIFGLYSHYALLYSGLDREWRKRLAIGIPGWILAACAVWHATSILLGI
jgi:hypothetical protein